MSRGRRGLRDRWRHEVLRSAAISDSVRVLLLLMADSMTEHGYVSVPRSELARDLGRSPRRITERIQAARDACFLDIVRSAIPNRTAEYVATIPSRGADGRTSSEVRTAATIGVRTGAPHLAHARDRDVRFGGADGGPPNTRVTKARETNYAPTSGSPSCIGLRRKAS